MAKFKAGDNVTREVNGVAATLTIIAVNDDTYTVMNNLGQTEEFSIRSVDRLFSLHTGGW